MKNKQSENKFFKGLAVEMGIVELEMVKKCYYGLVKAITKGIKTGGIFELPEFGSFKLASYKGGSAHNINTGGRVEVKERRVVQFKPNYKLKEWAKDL